MMRENLNSITNSCHLAAKSFILLLLTLLTNVVLSNAAHASDKQQPQCVRTSTYDIYLSGIHTGTMSRTERWRGDSAVVTSKSRASILGIGTQYHQRAELSWSNSSKEWLTKKFHQKVTGFRSRDMQVTFNNSGLRSRVIIDGEVESYRSEKIPLRDVDTLAIQIREHLLQGDQQFSLIRQASDAIEPYQFAVKAAQTTKIEPWGELTLLPVEQTGAEDVTYYFAPTMDYLLIKARYHGFILRGLIELKSYTSSCKPALPSNR